MDDFTELLDRAIPLAPDNLPSATERVAAGRQAVRRRRRITLAVGGVGLAALAVLPVALPDPGPSGTPAATSESSADPIVTGEPVYSKTPLLNFDFGALTVEDGAEFVQRVDRPIAVADIESVAGEMTYQNETYWAFAAAKRPSLDSLHAERTFTVAMSRTVEVIPGRAFEAWLSEQRVLTTTSLSGTDMTDGEFTPGWVSIDDDGLLTPAAGVRILEQTTPARPDQAPAGVPSASGLIEVDGARLCVLARKGLGNPEVLYVAESEHQGCGDAVSAWTPEFGTEGHLGLVTFEDGTFTPNTRPDRLEVAITQQIANPELPAAFDPMAGTGVVEYTVDGARYFGFARDHGDGTVDQYEREAEPGQTLEDYLDLVREGFKTGEPTGRFAR